MGAKLNAVIVRAAVFISVDTSAGSVSVTDGAVFQSPRGVGACIAASKGVIPAVHASEATTWFDAIWMQVPPQNHVRL
jgi:hypothetical protein